ncbi:predicted protein [Lichtheimia corymbifera JMRC:FSU:9682]|uniref:Uncharacterized protein n=1 Tax=Lichtheimia corymbifera JMRC:FSU:9682 TaxID=1263082 RepID=A0A068RPH3_9FUNG|nr:predicted protein [Lichtheimia corymbifera JMRC:FSU:9682]
MRTKLISMAERPFRQSFIFEITNIGGRGPYILSMFPSIHPGAANPNFIMKCGIFMRTKLLAVIESTLHESFRLEIANLRLREDPLWLVVTLGESENGHDDCETSTQGAHDPAAQLCSIEEPTFHCKV